ncbi:MAG: restriction endonuclease [FCB group bacterium]|nr:restriction endonuclease [FCB group bacterium]MBL7027415.1 restriction endonuclease [Candidatus Neomarinimicrobiota bacterium]MBL7122603.1 restriction endonuclease [Candidatus Neomarinimicrobiota bacterium]
MSKESRQFELLTKEMFELLRNDPKIEEVEHDVRLKGADGRRQIDVVLRGKVGPINILTIVECKDWNKKIDVQTLDAFHSKAQDVRANKAVVVSRKGFTKTAIAKAKRLGIVLCTLHDVRNEKWKFHPEIPVTVREIGLLDVSDTYEFTATTPTPIVFPVICNGVQLRDLFFSEWNKGNIKELALDKIHSWDPNLEKPFRILNQKGEYIPISSLDIKYKTTENIFFGYVGQLDYKKGIFFVDRQEGRMFFDEDLGFDYRGKFLKCDSINDIPFTELFAITFSVRSDVKKVSQPNYRARPMKS